MKSGAERQGRVRDLMAIVGLDEAFENSFPYEFSGGQQQRVGIARALALNPKFIVCDEPVSALDVSIQAQIIALLAKLRKDFALSYLFIAHDLGVIKYISDKIAVMYLGRIAEIGSKEALFRRSAHPYTRALIQAVPSIPKDGVQKKRFEVLKGEIPSPIDMPPGCRFASRCPYVKERCAIEEPELAEIERDHFVACHFPLD
jgi:peptide/nickel transport system ATP-binding protein